MPWFMQEAEVEPLIYRQTVQMPG